MGVDAIVVVVGRTGADTVARREPRASAIVEPEARLSRDRSLRDRSSGSRTASTASVGVSVGKEEEVEREGGWLPSRKLGPAMTASLFYVCRYVETQRSTAQHSTA